MTIQTTLLIISFLLVVMLGLLVWVIRSMVQRKVFILQALTIQDAKSVIKKQKYHQPKYANSNLKESEKEAFLNDLVMHLEIQKTYRQPDLSIARLGKQIKIPKHYLSQIINEKMQCSFLDLINRYRVAEAKEKLLAPEYKDQPILAIGRLVGFNAKSTFYAAFKKYTNCSPGDYRKAHMWKAKKLLE